MGRTLQELERQIAQDNAEYQRLRELRGDRFVDRRELIADLEQVKRIIHRKKQRSRAIRDDELFPNWSPERVAVAREQIADDVEHAEAEADELAEAIDVKSNLLQKVSNRIGRNRKRVKRLRRIATDKRKQRGALSPNFVRAEFDCRDGTRVPEAAIPALKALCQDVLEPQRARFGTVRINSGYRTPTYNDSIGGEPNSCHLMMHGHPAPYVAAADHVCGSGSASDWYAATSGKADGRGRYSNFHHADNRNRIGWADATWSG